MKPTTKAEMAIRGMFELALGTPSKPMALSKLAEKQSVSLSYLEQVFAALRKEGLVLSVRGPGGGYLLARPADQISTGEIIQAVNGVGNRDNAANSEPSQTDLKLNDFWQSAQFGLISMLSEISLLDVIEGRLLPQLTNHETTPQAAE